MGKSWDSTGIAYNVNMWKECLRVLKPGGYLLAFGGTRTYHRMACAIEDAGFEIRDQMQWLYGSGFPKSLDISKAIDKKFGAEREIISTKTTKSGGMAHIMKTNVEQEYRPSDYYFEKGNVINETLPATQEAKTYFGWGTALKPANEPICMARKPLSEKTVADNVLKWGTGGINIDECRIETTDNLNGGAYSGGQRSDGDWKENSGFRNDNLTGTYKQPTGRFPANLILDEDAANMLDEQSGTVSYGNKSGGYNYSGNEYEVEGFVKSCKPKAPSNYGDSGGASRFFYCAKAAKKEKGNGNNHPTVKPLKLMEYLVKLVTPPNGICLDPFAGSGTTALAALNLEKRFIGIEMDTTYCGIIVSRIRDTDKKYA